MINKKIILLLSVFFCSPLLIFCGTGAMAETIDGLSDPGPTPASVSCNVTNNTLLVCNYTDWYPSSWSAQTPVSTGYKFLAVRMQYGDPRGGMVCAREGPGPFLFVPRTVCSNYGFGRYSGSMSAVTVQTDTDGDVRINTYDNCPSTSNTDQLNTDGDTQGDACDTDDDNDGVADTSDNCPLNANANQLNTDGDAQGDVCDTDDDNDGVSDGSDKFPLDPTETIDTDNDGIGNNADLDDDNDGVPDYIDAAPLNAANASEVMLPLNNGYKGSSVSESVALPL